MLYRVAKSLTIVKYFLIAVSIGMLSSKMYFLNTLRVSLSLGRLSLLFSLKYMLPIELVLHGKKLLGKR